MKVSAKAEYACVALIELASRHGKGLPTSIKAIAEQYGISSAFLTQIFLQLKGAGMVMSVRGSAGGYQLAQPPERINLADIVETIDGQPQGSSALYSMPQSPIIHTLQGVWTRVQKLQRKILEEITVADLHRQAHEAGVVFYQI